MPLFDLEEYGKYALSWASGQDWRNLAIAVMATLTVVGFLWLRSDRYRERAVAKLRIRQKWEKEKALAQEEISKLLQHLHTSGKLSINGTDRLHQMLHDAGFKQVGFSPATGRQWWRNWPTFNPMAAKDAAWKRIMSTGVNVRAKLDEMKKRRAKPKRTEQLQVKLKTRSLHTVGPKGQLP